MKVLIINTSELTGGAALAAHRLYAALRRNGVDAKMMVALRQTDDENVLTAAPRWAHQLHSLTERGVIWAANGFRRRGLFTIDTAMCGTDITRTRAYKEADVVHLHWINQGFLSLRTIGKILHSGKRVVWTLHDEWPFSGVCHYTADCHAGLDACSPCSLSPMTLVSTACFQGKRRAYSGADVRWVACSHWMREQACLSPLLRGHSVQTIPNALDTATFCPGERAEARKLLGLPLRKLLVLFASQRVTDERKGMRYLVEAAQVMRERHPQTAARMEFVVMGQNADHLASMIPMPVHALGYVSQDERLAAAYRAADMFVTPSLQDNLPNTIAEAMACGTPCVGFRVGGIPEMIDHLSNGYVAHYRDSQDLADGIEHVAQHPLMGQAAEHYAAYTYDQDRVAQQYLQCYSR